MQTLFYVIVDGRLEFVSKTDGCEQTFGQCEAIIGQLRPLFDYLTLEIFVYI